MMWRGERNSIVRLQLDQVPYTESPLMVTDNGTGAFAQTQVRQLLTEEKKSWTLKFRDSSKPPQARKNNEKNIKEL